MVTVTPSGSTTAAVTYTPIATQTISSAILSVTFTNIPATYKDLVLEKGNGGFLAPSFKLSTVVSANEPRIKSNHF